MRKGVLAGFLLFHSFAIAQAVVPGYTQLPPVPVAPGSIVTFLTEDVTSLTSLSVALRQGASAVNPPSMNVPILSSSIGTVCPDYPYVDDTEALNCGNEAKIVVQIPYEMTAVCLTCVLDTGGTTLLLSQNGKPLTAIQVTPVADAVRVLTECDIEPFLQQPVNLAGLPCTPLVTHANGQLVSADIPAKPGETLTAWVYGLGQTTPAAATGRPAVQAPTAESFYLDFNYRVNALPTKPYTGEPDVQPPQPLYAGLAPGYIGLYQVNFTVPPAPPNGIPQCAPAGTTEIGMNVVQSNLTVSIGGPFSFDGAGICVATQIPVD